MMDRDINVIIVEDDIYARYWMELMLRRDWRTRVIGQAQDGATLAGILDDFEKHNQRVDLILIDVDIPDNPNWLNRVLTILEKKKQKAVILFTGVNPRSQVIKLMERPGVSGFILKAEIVYSLVWAILYAVNHHFVITPGVTKSFASENSLPNGTVILDGRYLTANLQEKISDRARMAFIFSMERNELADELGVDEDYAYGITSDLFEKIGLNDVLRGEIEPKEYFDNNPIVLAHIMQAIHDMKKDTIEEKKGYKGDIVPQNNGIPQLERLPKIKEKETLAFHLLTLPMIEEIS